MTPNTRLYDALNVYTMELFLCGLGGRGQSGSNDPDWFAGGAAQKQHDPSMVCATGPATSGGDLTAVGQVSWCGNREKTS